MNERTHASFFSGVGGLDLGLERAGWRTVSFSEIDPYASAVLAERWPGVPNLGNILDLVGDERPGDDRRVGVPPRAAEYGRDANPQRLFDPDGWQDAYLWTGGFPCQDLSIAGKRRGLDGARSGLAFAYLELVERHRPPWVLLENVPGLLSSNRGRDLAVLLGRLAELGYGVAYRVLDARYFGVAQRRRRVFILASRDPGGRLGAERAAEVLSLAASGGGHPATGGEAGSRAASSFDGGAHGVVGPIRSHLRPGTNTLTGIVLAGPPDDARGQGRRRQGAVDLGEREPDAGHVADADAVRRPTGASSDAGRDGAPDGLAGRLDDRQRVADDPLLPLGLDSHRYRCCGNGVVSNVAEVIGRALIAVIEMEAVAA